MKLLLDTHIWIWSYLEPHKITSAVARELTNRENDRFLSSVSIWETVLLLEKKRLRLNRDFGGWFHNAKEDLDLIEVPVTWDVALALHSTRIDHSDPADRFLVATAKVYDMTLVTADARLMRVPGLAVLPNQ